MRVVPSAEVAEAVKALCMQASWFLPEEVTASLKKAEANATSSLSRGVLQQILNNNQIAATERIPMCMDTGVSIVFMDVGSEVFIEGGTLQETLNAGVSAAFGEGYLRPSIVEDPLRRKNTGDNTPAFLHYRQVEGDKITITFMPKGGGGENMSRMEMLAPTALRSEVMNYIVETVRIAGPNACPPVTVGVGLGGTYETVGLLAKRSLLRPIGTPNPDPFYAELEDEVFAAVNALQIGPQGLGGRATALAVHVTAAACDISNMPIAVNLQCHSARYAKIEI